MQMLTGSRHVGPTTRRDLVPPDTPATAARADDDAGRCNARSEAIEEPSVLQVRGDMPVACGSLTATQCSAHPTSSI